jgi:hypothetical protein
MDATHATTSSGSFYSAVCYRCGYVGMEASACRCPLCAFPLILEPGQVADRAPAIEEIFDRVSVSVGAPPLPGVDGRPRKAQLLAEARRRRRQTTGAPARPETAAEAPAPPRRLRSVFAVGIALASAAVAGLLAACVI